MMLTLVASLAVLAAPAPAASPASLEASVPRAVAADLEALLEGLAADELLTGWQFTVVHEHPLHPVLAIGTLDPGGPLAEQLGPWLEAQRAALGACPLVRADLRAELVARFLPVVCLRDRATWESLVGDAGRAGGFSEGLARYSPAHGCVFARDGEGNEDYPLARRHAALQAVGRELLSPMVSPDLGGSEEDWLLHGIASRYAIAGGSDPQVLSEGSYDGAYLRDVRRMCENQPQFEAYWTPIGELVATRGPRASHTIAVERHGSTVSRRWRDQLAWSFTLASWTWVRYLEQLAAGERTALEAYVDLSLAGDGGMEELVALAGFETELALRTAFFDWLAEKVRAETRIRMGRPDLSPPAPVEEPAGTSAATSVEPELLPPTPLEAFNPTGASSQFALAMSEAAGGRLEPALARLAAIEAGGEPAGPRTARMAVRLEALAAARVALLEQAAGGPKLRLVRGDDTYVLEGVEFDGERLTIEPSSRHEFTELRPEELGAESLALNFKRRSERYGEAWVEAFAQWLCGEPKWSRAVPRDVEDAELKSDLEALPDVLERGAALRGLLDTQRAAAGEGGGVGLGGLLASRELFGPEAAFAQFALVYRGALEFELRAAAASLAPSDLLDADVQSLGGDRVLLAYGMRGDSLSPDFAAAGNLSERRQRPYPEDWPLGSGVRPTEEGLRFLGQDSIEHRLVLSPPLRLSFEVQYIYPPDQENLGQFIAGVCRLPEERELMCWGMVEMEGFDREQGLYEYSAGVFDPALPPAIYRFELEYDGTRARLLSGREPKVTLDLAGLRGGKTVFGVSSDHPILLRDVRLEGVLDSPALERLREEWVAESLERALLGELDAEYAAGE